MLYSDHKSGKSRMGVFTKYIRGIVITALIFVLIFPVQTYAKGRKIDIIVFAGQSNMMGHGNAKTATKIKKKTGYSYLPVTAPEEISAFKEPFGRNENDDYFNNIMNGENYSTGSLVSSFIKSYNAKTNTRVLAVPAAMMGTGSYSWAEYRYKGIISRVNEAKEAAEDAGYEIDHTYMVWLQGESDALAMQRNADGSCDSGMSESVYIRNVKKMYSRVSKKTDISTCFVITIPSYYGFERDPYGTTWSEYYKKIQNAQMKLCKKSDDFVMIYEDTPKLEASYIQSDGIHLTQEALNKVGLAAGKKAGAYAKND